MQARTAQHLAASCAARHLRSTGASCSAAGAAAAATASCTHGDAPGAAGFDSATVQCCWRASRPSMPGCPSGAGSVWVGGSPSISQARSMAVVPAFGCPCAGVAGSGSAGPPMRARLACSTLPLSRARAAGTARGAAALSGCARARLPRPSVLGSSRGGGAAATRAASTSGLTPPHPPGACSAWTCTTRTAVTSSASSFTCRSSMIRKRTPTHRKGERHHEAAF